MEFTITLAWWVVPTLITVVACGYALFIHDNGGGMFAELDNIFMLVPALVVSMLAWIVAAFLK